MAEDHGMHSCIHFHQHHKRGQAEIGGQTMFTTMAVQSLKRLKTRQEELKVLKVHETSIKLIRPKRSRSLLI